MNLPFKTAIAAGTIFASISSANALTVEDLHLSATAVPGIYDATATAALVWGAILDNLDSVAEYNSLLSAFGITMPLNLSVAPLQVSADPAGGEWTATLDFSTLYTVAFSVTEDITSNGIGTSEMGLLGLEPKVLGDGSLNYNVSAVAVPGPIAGAGLPLVLAALGFGAYRRRRQTA